jgi:hypothetical protein
MAKFDREIMKVLRQRVFDLEEDNTSMDHLINEMTLIGAFREYIDWYYGEFNGVRIEGILERFNLLKGV